MEISNPRRILLIGAPDAGHLDLLKALTGSSPTPTSDSLAGLSHDLPLKTAYYSAQIPIWIDEISLKQPSTWSADFLLPEAREVLSALGAIILIFRKPVSQKDYEQVRGVLGEVGKVIKDGCGDYWDGVVLAVGMKQDVVPNLEISDMEWEDVCGRFGPRGGFEWVDFEGVGRNEFNEPKGVARIKEALEATDWDGMGDDNLDLDGLDEFDGDDGFDAEAIELEMEMFGMKQAIYGAGDGGGESKDGDNAQNTGGNKKTGSDEEDGVEQLESMMLRLQAVKDMGAGLPEQEKKRFAAKAVADIMKTL